MHYTSIENIHKLIDPLFLDGLKAEFAEIKEITVDRTRKAKLESFQMKLAGLKFLDPACGSGNFLTETYISLHVAPVKILAGIFQKERFQFFCERRDFNILVIEQAAINSQRFKA